MSRMSIRLRACVTALLLSLVPAVPTLAQSASQTLGSVRIPRQVLADGQALAAGTYAVRLADRAFTPVVGQAPDSERWVEFVQGGQVRGRELATVVKAPDATSVLKGPGPASGGAKVETLKGDDYIRVWLNQGGTHYLVHLSAAAR